MICGCGQQALPHVEALMDVLPLRSVWAWDILSEKASELAAGCEKLGLEAKSVRSLETGRKCDVIVTCTTADRAFLGPEHVEPGAFIAAVGADSPKKGEIKPILMEHATVVVDVLSQCADMGDLRLALACAALSSSDVHADLADLVSGAKPGRTSADEITLFDSTGTAIEDVASAAVIYERTQSMDCGLPFAFAS
jgi:alanine dehydrogenase